MYRVAAATEYLVITGTGITDVKVVKKCMVWPGQLMTKFSMTPQNYTLSLHAMTVEKLEFTLPAVFTIGPEDTPASVIRYAKLLGSGTEKGIKHIQELVTGIVEGETRVMAASLTMEEIFKDRKFFKEHVMQGIQSELKQFGMIVYNANVKQLQDSPGSEYFKYLRLKSQEGAINQAKVDVAQAKCLGAVGEQEKNAEQRKKIIQIETETVIFEQQRTSAMVEAQSKLSTEKTIFTNNVHMAEIEAKQKIAIRDADLQREVEIKNALVAQERARAENLSKATVEAEMIEALATAALFKAKKEADAHFYEKQKEAEAMQVTYEAQAKGIQLLQNAFNGDNAATLQYIMIDRGIFTALAKSNADAVKGMEPKISVWNTGSDGNDDAGKSIRDVFQTLPPLMSIISEQTGIQPPTWMMGNVPTRVTSKSNEV